ncbi:putative Glutathione S-transferase 3 [Seiridium unicorne]|uniref:Glutathione S-transferase 3 n=1 Tax=Seiridium unicorne TaxID=138068 RepID=A0ABR2UXZ7_9PEZI
MSLEVYHLQLSQSERIVWLLEELAIPYNLHVFKRNPATALAPDDLKAINPYGTAPYFRDTSTSPEVSLSESAAIVSYILSKYPASHEGTRLNRTPDDPDYATYLQWFHYANGSVQPSISRQMTMHLAGAGDSPGAKIFQNGFLRQLKLVDEHLGKNKWFAGEQLSAADCMMMFSFSTMRGFSPYSLVPYPNILRWMKDVSERPAYKRAMEKGEDGRAPMIEPVTGRFTHFPAFKEVLEKIEV